MTEPVGTHALSLGRAGLSSQLAEILCAWGVGTVPELEPMLRGYVDSLGAGDVERFIGLATTTGRGWGYHPPHALARRVSREVMGRVVETGSRLHGASRLAVAHSRRAVFLGNHLSFVDANLLDYLMAEAGHGAVCDGLTTLVGPKVFTLPIRRLASLCFGTIKLPQSASRASGEARMSPREVAGIARTIFRTARERQTLGDHLLIFPEGARSRGGAMQRCLAGVARYLENPEAVVIPFGLVGCERLVPVDEDRLYPARVDGWVGPAVEIETLHARCGRNRTLMMDVIGFLIADLLPDERRGAYADPAALPQAHEIAVGLGAGG